jgi:hypothetical protein
VEFMGSGGGITIGSVVLESDRILQSDPIESDNWVKLGKIASPTTDSMNSNQTRSNYDLTVGFFSDSEIRIPIGFIRMVGSD